MKNIKLYIIYIFISLVFIGGIAFWFIYVRDNDSGNRAFGPEAVLTTVEREGYSFQYPTEWQMKESDGTIRLDLPGGEEIQDPNPTDDIVFSLEDKYLEDFSAFVKDDFYTSYEGEVIVDKHRGFRFKESGIVEADSYLIEIKPGLLLYFSAEEGLEGFSEVFKTIRFED